MTTIASTAGAATPPAATPAPTASNSALGKLSGDFDTFLRMLTTQLQNQDPTNPMDTNQMTDQLTQFSQVEQQISTNQNLQQIMAALSATSANQNLGYLGRVVEFDSDKLALMTVGNNNGAELREAVVAYNLPTVAEDVDVQIIDPKTGQVVRTITGDTDVGRHTVAWDGKNDSGAQLPNGVYNFRVVAKDADDAPIANVKTSFIGLVYSLENTPTGASLDVGMGLKIDPAAIKQVHAI